jgi:hypothetical protein
MAEKQFYDRKNELDLLKRKYDLLDSGEMLIIYGRRRVGKTELIKQFLNLFSGNKLYFYVDLAGKQDILNSMSNSIQEQLKEGVNFLDFDSFFKYIEAKCVKEKFILVIDEFQRFLEVAPEFITKLQNYWDSRLSNGKIMIILVGSSIGMIQKITESRAGALYGRGAKMKISPFRYSDFRIMFKELKEEEKVAYYSVFGGTPHYLKKAKKAEGDIFQKINELIIKKGADLCEEPKALMEYENVRVHAKYNSILSSISSGKETMKEMEDFTKIISSQMTPYLNKLDNLLDLVKRNDPVLGKERLGRYCIKDNFFNFWYKFIFPNQTSINLGNPKIVFDLVKENLNSYIGRIFEGIIKELFVLYNTKEIKGLKLNFENIGSWWDRKGNEIDLLAYNLKEKTFIVGEIKWTNKPMDSDVVEELLRKSKLLGYAGVYKYFFASKNGFTEKALNRLRELGAFHIDLKEMGGLFDNAMI